MSIFKEVKKDYLELTGKHGQPYDMTGGFVDSDQILPVILNPPSVSVRLNKNPVS